MTNADNTVLIVEDERKLADVYAGWLASDYDVRTAYDGSTALELIGDEIDCMLLDRRMPGVSGDEVLETVRDLDIECPVAILTAVDPDFDIVEMGFTDYIKKPVSEEELRSIVDDMLRLGTYDELVQRYYRLASKKATLEATKWDAELAESEEYQDLLAELERVKNNADEQGQQLLENGELLRSL